MGKLRVTLARMYWWLREIPVIGVVTRMIYKLYVWSQSAIYRVSRGRLAGKVQGVPLLILSTPGSSLRQMATEPVDVHEKG